MLKLSSIAKQLLLESRIKDGVDFVFEQNPELNIIGTKEQYSKYLDTVFPNSKVKDIVFHSTIGTWYRTDKFRSTAKKNTVNPSNKYGFWFGSNDKLTRLFNTIDLSQFYITYLYDDYSVLEKKFNILQKQYNLTDEEKEAMVKEFYKYANEQEYNRRNDTRRHYPLPKSSTLAAILDMKKPAQGDTYVFAGKTRGHSEDSLNYLISLGGDSVILPQIKDGGPGGDEFEKGINYVVKSPRQIHVLGSKKDIEGFKKFVGK